MFIGEQPKRDPRRQPSEKAKAAGPRKGTKRNASEITDEVALSVSKTMTTISISKADTSKINTPDTYGVSACLRCTILCCCLLF